METPTATAEALHAFVGDAAYPCVMAKSVLKRDQFDYHVYPEIGTPEAARLLAADLRAYAADQDPERGFRSFMAVFEGSAPADEVAFENALWATLAALHEADDAEWDPAVSSDPSQPEFSFSFAGRAFYVVGMHPAASRPARRFAHPMLVFNLHAQFEQLRAQGRYEKVRDLIRERDRAFAGSVNPMMHDFGTRSEARQYAGRAVPSDWRCPFHAQHASDD